MYILLCCILHYAVMYTVTAMQYNIILYNTTLYISSQCINTNKMGVVHKIKSTQLLICCILWPSCVIVCFIYKLKYADIAYYMQINTSMKVEIFRRVVSHFTCFFAFPSDHGQVVFHNRGHTEMLLRQLRGYNEMLLA